jgi:hypothetical protein
MGGCVRAEIRLILTHRLFPLKSLAGAFDPFVAGVQGVI